jgi:hypothetical protein
MDVLWTGTPVVTLPGTVKFQHPWDWAITGLSDIADYQKLWMIRWSLC